MNIVSSRILAWVIGLVLPAVAMADEADRRFYVYNAANGLADNSAQTVNCTKTGRLVITTLGQINFFDGQQFTYIDPTTENTYPLSKYNGHAHLYFDKHHHIWLKKRHSLSCVNLTKERFATSIIDEFSNLGVESQVEDLFGDQNNDLYLLTAKGLYCVDSKKLYKVRPKLNLQDMEVYKDKYLLLFYENGEVDVLDQTSGELVETTKAYDETREKKYGDTSVLHATGNFIYQIRNGVWNGNNVAILQKLDISTWKWEIVMETPYYLSNIKEKDSTLYIPSAYGYWTIDMVTGKKQHIEELRMSDGRLLLTDINCLEFDRQGGLWLGTEKRGLLYSRPFSVPFKILSWADHRAIELSNLMDQKVTPQTTYREKSVNCVFRDSRGWDWVGTSTGLQLYQNKGAMLPQLFTRNEGLLNNVVHCVVEDNKHNIWVATSYGICCLVIRDGKVRYVSRYNEWDGLPKESFVNGRSMLLPGGEVVMQALDHVITFKPDEMTTINDKISYEIYPKLIRLFVNGNDIHPEEQLDGKVILDKALTRTKEINLNYNQNTVSLTFSGLNYFRPQQTFYRVKVTGPDQDGSWKVMTPYNSGGLVDRSGQLHLPLSSLRPGQYNIEVQTSMLPDDWETVPYEWIVKVHEPWWRTTGVLMLLGLLLFILLLVYLYLYMKNANLKARRNNEERGIIRQIRLLAERCDTSSGMVLEPSPHDVYYEEGFVPVEVDSSFFEVMKKIVPTVMAKDPKRLTMRELCSQAGMSIQDFYGIINQNIYKNLRPVVIDLRLDHGAKLLLEQKGKDIAAISSECGFATPNFFIASFLHKYHQTPEEFRSK